MPDSGNPVGFLLYKKPEMINLLERSPRFNVKRNPNETRRS
jgi:hypothetical protein